MSEKIPEKIELPKEQSMETSPERKDAVPQIKEETELEEKQAQEIIENIYRTGTGSTKTPTVKKPAVKEGQRTIDYFVEKAVKEKGAGKPINGTIEEVRGLGPHALDEFHDKLLKRLNLEEEKQP